MKKLDKKDRKILTILADNPRVTYTELAKYVQLSKNAAKYRLDRLHRLNIIRNVLPVINYLKLGMITYEVFLKCNPTKEKKRKLEQHLATQENILWSAATFGAYDYFFEVLCKNPFELDGVICEITKILGDSFKDFKTIIATRRLKIRHLVGELHEPVPGWPGHKKLTFNETPVTLDLLDKKILKELCIDGRKTYYEISKSVKTTLQTVRNRVRKMMMDTTIIQFMPMIGYKELGYIDYILLLRTRLTTKEQEDKLADYFHAQGPVKLALHVVNTNELELLVCVRHPDELERLIIDMRERFPKQVVGVDFMHLTKELKLNFFPKGLL